MKFTRPFLIYGLPALLWLLVAGWQAAEHRRACAVARQTLFGRARDIAVTLEVVLHAQGRFGAMPKARVEAALKGLALSEDLVSVALVNPAGDTVAAAGKPLTEAQSGLAPGGWARNGEDLTVAELLRLAPGWGRPGSSRREGGVILLDGDDGPLPGRGPGQGFGPGGGPPPPGEEFGPAGDRLRDWFRRGGRGWRFGEGGPRLTPDEFNDLYERQGVHKFVVVVSGRLVAAMIRRDARLREILVGVALLAMAGLGFGFRSLDRAGELRVRLARADELNTHLQEMNTAAAGLAHETRNPLNVVRGIAQMILAHPEDVEKSRRHAGTVIEEVDRVSSRLGDFLSYARPRVPEVAAVDPAGVVEGVIRILESDGEENEVALESACPAGITVAADEGMLRQILFNLVLNGIQATPAGGRVTVGLDRAEDGLWQLHVRDTGPGVPPDLREDVFKPYFTLREGGTGLGLAVVRRLALAHGWDIRCGEAPGGGAEFRLAGIRAEAAGPASRELS